MENILVCLLLAALAGIPIGLFSAIIKKIKGKSAKKSLKMTGLSIAVFLAVAFIYPETPDEMPDTDKNQATAVSGGADLPAQTKADDDISEEFEDKTEELDNEDSGSKQGTGHSEEEEYIGDKLCLDETTDFSEGRAWVQYNVMDKEKGSAKAFAESVSAAMGDDFDRIQYLVENYDLRGNKAALIDTNGKILWESEATEKDTVLEQVSEFRDGLAYCIFNGNDKKTYIIVDAQGNTVFTRDFHEDDMDEDDMDYIILGHGGGLVLAAEHVADFSTNEWRIGAIDKNGAIAVPFQVYENKPNEGLEAVEAPSGEEPDPNYDYDGYLKYHEQLEAYEEYESECSVSYPLSFDNYNREESCEYLGDGVFGLSCPEWSVLLNIKTQKIIYSYDNYMGRLISTFITKFKDGVATVVYSVFHGLKNEQYISSLRTDGTFTETISNDWINYHLKSHMEFGDGLVFVSDTVAQNEIYGEVMQENLTTGAYYDKDGRKVIDFPEYDDKNLYYCCTPFQNGYAVMYIEGADEYLYTTVINKKGKRMFEPKTGFNPSYISEDGRYLTAIGNGYLTVFDIKGKALMDIKSKSISSNSEYNVHDEMINVNNFYVNIENGTVIGMYENAKDSVTVY